MSAHSRVAKVGEQKPFLITFVASNVHIIILFSFTIEAYLHIRLTLRTDQSELAFGAVVNYL